MEVAGSPLDINGFPSQIYAEEMVVDYGESPSQKSTKNSAPVTIYRLIKREDAEALGISLQEGSVSTPNENTKVITRQIIKLDKNSPLIKKNDKSLKLDAVADNSLAVNFDDNKQDSEEHKFGCDSCPKRFRHLSHLKRHANGHSGERRYSCGDCAKSFLDASTLLRHRRIHSGERPHECATCGKSFAALGSLRRHATVHDPAGRRFACVACDKRFPDNSSYRKHLLTHDGVRPHICDVCDKRFYHVGDLNGHRKIHQLVKPHNCAHCHRQFVKHSNYSRHLLIHEGGKRFACHICTVGYNFQSSLTRHLLTHVKRTPAGSAHKSTSLDGENASDPAKLSMSTIRHLLGDGQMLVGDARWDDIVDTDEWREGDANDGPAFEVRAIGYDAGHEYSVEVDELLDGNEYRVVAEDDLAGDRYEVEVSGQYRCLTSEDGDIVYEIVEEGFEGLDVADGEVVVS